MQWLTHTQTQRWHAHYHTSGTGHLYQGRFKSFPVQRGLHLLLVLRYVERNALRANLVARAQDWVWGSLWRRENKRGLAILTDWPIERPEDWKEFVNEPHSAEELEALRRSAHRGCPFGDDDWQKAIVREAGLGVDGSATRKTQENTGRRSDMNHVPFSVAMRFVVHSALIVLFCCVLVGHAASSSGPVAAPSVDAIVTKAKATLAALDTSEYSFENAGRYSIPNKNAPEAFSKTGHIRRDKRGWWLTRYSDWSGSLSMPIAQRKSHDFISSFVSEYLVYQTNPPIPGVPPGTIGLYPQARAKQMSGGKTTLGREGMLLEGYALADQNPDSLPISIFDVLQDASGEPHVLPDANGRLVNINVKNKYGNYEVTFDPEKGFTISKIEITKSENDVFQGSALRLVLGSKENRLYPKSPTSRYHLVLEVLGVSKIGDTFVVDSANVTEEKEYQDREKVTLHSTVQWKDIKLNGKYSEADFALDAPDGTPVIDLRPKPSGPVQEWRGGKLVPKVDPGTVKNLDKSAQNLK